MNLRRFSLVRNGFVKLTTLDVRAAAAEIYATGEGHQPDCPFMIALNAAEGEGIDLLARSATFPGYTPSAVAIPCLGSSADLFEDGPLGVWEGFWVGELTRQPFEVIGRTVRALVRQQGDTLTPEAAETLSTWLAQNARA